MTSVLRPTTFAAIAALAASVRPAWAEPFAGPQGYWRDDYWGMGHMMVGGFGMVLFVVLTVVLVVLAIRWLGGTHAPNPPPPAQKRAIDILEERFARGEIDREEFIQKRNDLLS